MYLSIIKSSGWLVEFTYWFKAIGGGGLSDVQYTKDNFTQCEI